MSKQTTKKITGTTIEEVKRSTELALQGIWSEVNKLIDETRSSKVGTRKQETNDTGMRLVQDKGNYHLEGKFKDGWARLATTTTLLTKKE